MDPSLSMPVLVMDPSSERDQPSAVSLANPRAGEEITSLDVSWKDWQTRQH